MVGNNRPEGRTNVRFLPWFFNSIITFQLKVFLYVCMQLTILIRWRTTTKYYMYIKIIKLEIDAVALNLCEKCDFYFEVNTIVRDTCVK